MGTTSSSASSSAQADDVINLHARPEPGGGSSAKVTLTPESDKRTKKIHCDPRPSIPVIFVPGVMGSVLTNRRNGSPVWNPPNDKVSRGAISFLYNGYYANASARERQYDPFSACVTPLGAVNTSGCDLSDEGARRRGWGTVHSASYHASLAWLERELNNPMAAGKPTGVWASGDDKGDTFTQKPLLGTSPTEFGAHGAADVLQAIQATSEDFKKFCHFQYPVYAIGYNWLQSNLDSAKDLIEGVDYVDKRTGKKYRIMGVREICAENKVKKAIIVTHSMGGLVARMACVIAGNADLFYGVFHGAQPATGAALAARRFRAGGASEGVINKSLVGRDALEFTAVTANAPGPLELLPMPDYHNFRPWWIFRDYRKNEVLRLPKPNATFDLFANPKWYGLVPDNSSKVLDPAGIVAERLSKERTGKSVQQNFADTMKGVVTRQTALINNYHPNTYAAYGNGPLRQRLVAPKSVGGQLPASEVTKGSADLLTFGNVIWRGGIPAGTTEADMLAAELVHDDLQGTVTISIKGHFVTLGAEDNSVLIGADKGIIPGDGTVPVWSGESVARGLKPGLDGGTAKGVRIAFEQAGFDHQGCFSHPWPRWAVLYSMVNIAKSIDVPT